MREHEITGRSFGLLTAIKIDPMRSGTKRKWICRCACGAVHSVATSKLTTGRTTSCGCNQHNHLPTYKHGHGGKKGSRSTEYRTWSHIKTRCFNKNAKHYENYGGRGITMCEEWVASFEAFLAHVGRKPEPSMSIDRIDNASGYVPGNVRWASKKTQANNRRRRRWKSKSQGLSCI